MTVLLQLLKPPRWNMHRKAAVIEAVRVGIVPRASALAVGRWSVEEWERMVDLYRRHGKEGLRALRKRRAA